MSNRSPKLSIVIVTYGTGPVVLDAIEAVGQFTDLEHQVIVVDNPPDDGRPRSAAMLRAVKGITLIEADQNLGFAGGNNLGASLADGDLLCLLNPDVVVGPGWLEPLVAALDDPAVGIAAPILVNPDGSLQEAGQLIYNDGCTAAIGGPEVLTGDWAQAFTRDVDYSSAACWMLCRSDFLDLGGLDVRYRPAYFEDSDFALRVEASGRRTRLVAGVPVVHHHGSGGSANSLTLGEQSRQTFRTVWESRLDDQPHRPQTDCESLANRDRLVEGAVGWMARSRRSSVGVRRRALSETRRFALDHPRYRVVFATDDASALDVDGARHDGVEVVIGPVDDTVAARSAATVWHPVESRSGGVPAALRALWSPWTALIAVVGIVLRWLVLQSPWGYLNSDEAYTGLAAFGVLDGRFPVVIDGNRYTAVLEAYIFAPVFALTGPSILVLKLIPIIFWAVTALLGYLAGSYLASRLVGAVTGALVWIAPGALLVVSTTAYVGYAFGMAISVAGLLTAAVVIDRERPSVNMSALFGGCAGLGIYVHPMYLAVFVPLSVSVALHHRRNWKAFWLPFVGAGLAANLPFLLWNASNGFPSLQLQNALPGTYADRLEAFATELVPRGYGLRDYYFEWVFGRTVGLVFYSGLVAAVIIGCVALVRRSERPSRWLVPVTLVAVWPLMALFSPLIWTDDGRYNVLTFPLVALAVASAIRAVPTKSNRALVLTGVAVVLGWFAVYVGPHTSRVVEQTSIDPNAALYAVVDYLESNEITEVAGSYWRVLTIEFASDRRISGAVVSPPDAVRFPDRQRRVQASSPDEVAFVFPIWVDEPSKLWMPPDNYERVVVGDTVVYLPTASS